MHVPETRLIVPDTPALINATREIFGEYAASLAIDLSFQHFNQELRDLPGEYAAPAGNLLLALVEGTVAGCGAYRRLTDVDYPNACEMKRLYVRRAFRRFGLGRQIAQALIDDARRTGYSSMLLDTLDDMEAARELYTTLGFVEVPPFYFNPLPGAHYLCVDLDNLHSRY
jgi:GNAT superfamily N-acetyltransferase